MTVAETQMWFDVWAADDLLGTALGTLTDATDRQIRSVDNGIGQGSFRINRNSSQFATLCDTDNLVRVRLETGGPFAYDDARYKFAFFIEEGEDEIVSADEDGGEVATLGGRDAAVILSRAIIDYEAHHPFNLTPIDFAKSATTDGQWHINGSEFVSGAVGTPGSVLRIFLRDADTQVPEPIPEVTHDFTVTDDSLNVTWSEGQTDWDFDVGTDLLTVLFILVEGGLYYRFHPSLLLQAFEDQPGTDLSATITLAAGVNVREAGTRTIHAQSVKSRVLVRGSNRNGLYRYKWVADSGIESSAIGVRQGFLDYQASPTTARLQRAGTTFLDRAKNRHDGPPTVGVLNEVGKVALIDYEPGDTVTVSVPEFNGAYRIHAIALIENEAGYVDPIVEFVDDGEVGLTTPSAETKAVGRSIELCRDGSACIETFTRTVASGGGTSEILALPWTGFAYTGSGTADDYISVDGASLKIELPTTDTIDPATYIAIAPTLPFECLVLARIVLLSPFNAGTNEPEFGIELTGGTDPFDTPLAGLSLAARVGFEDDLRIHAYKNDGTFAIDNENSAVTNFDGAWFRVRFRVTSTGVFAKAWNVSANEPDAYQASVSTTGTAYERLALIHGQGSDIDGSYVEVESIEMIEGVDCNTSTCIVGGPTATSGNANEDCGDKAAPCNHDHAYTSAQISHDGGTVEDALNAGAAITLSDDIPLVESGTGSAGTSTEASRSDHVHPDDGGGGGGGSATDFQTATAPTAEADLQWDTTLDYLTVHDGSGVKPVTPAGWMGRIAWPDSVPGNSVFSTTSHSLAASGGSIACPIPVPAPGRLRAIWFRHNTGASRLISAALYAQVGNSATAQRVANWTQFTAGAGSVIQQAVDSAPVVLPPGVYWLVIRNDDSSTASIGLGGGTWNISQQRGKTVGAALGSTLDLSTGWTSAAGQVGMALQFETLGEGALV